MADTHSLEVSRRYAKYKKEDPEDFLPCCLPAVIFWKKQTLGTESRAEAVGEEREGVTFALMELFCLDCGGDDTGYLSKVIALYVRKRAF